jgi:hypothetical protein
MDLPRSFAVACLMVPSMLGLSSGTDPLAIVLHPAPTTATASAIHILFIGRLLIDIRSSPGRTSNVWR